MKKRQSGKYANEKSKSKSSKKWLFVVILLIIVIAVFVVFKIKGLPINNPIENILSQENKEDENKEEIVEVEIPEQIEKYDVLGTITINKLGLEKNILDQTTDESLQLSVTKFYGPKLNEPGNFCITGHNYAGIFKYLGNLKIDDTFYIIDKEKSRKVTYKIYDMYTANPQDLDCLSQETGGKREVTLITCNPGGLTRLIIKAKEI